MRKARLDELDLKPRVRNALASLFERLADETWRQIDRLVLYGSVARGDDLDDSDVDLLVVWKGDRVEGTDRFGVLTTRIFIETGIDIAIHQMAPDEFQGIESVQSSFYQNLDQEGILVAG